MYHKNMTEYVGGFFLKAQLSRHSSGSFKPCILSSGLAIDKKALTGEKSL